MRVARSDDDDLHCRAAPGDRRRAACPGRVTLAWRREPEYAARVRILCISDIHGNADALAAVLATAERRGYTHLLVAGDICFPGPKPLETW